MTTKRILATPAVFLTGMFLATSVSAQSVKVNGAVTFVPASSHDSELTDGRTLRRRHIRGMMVADESSALWHLSTMDCQGTAVLAPDGSLEVERTLCDAVDADGEVWWLAGLIKPSGTTWRILGGTGKYEGMEGDGTVKRPAQFPDGRYSISYEGSYRMP